MVRANASPGLQLTSERALGPIPLIRRTCVDNPLFKRDTISLFTYFWGPYPCQQTRAPYDEDGECENDVTSHYTRLLVRSPSWFRTKIKLVEAELLWNVKRLSASVFTVSSDIKQNPVHLLSHSYI